MFTNSRSPLNPMFLHTQYNLFLLKFVPKGSEVCFIPQREVLEWIRSVEKVFGSKMECFLQSMSDKLGVTYRLNVPQHHLWLWTLEVITFWYTSKSHQLALPAYPHHHQFHHLSNQKPKCLENPITLFVINLYFISSISNLQML